MATTETILTADEFLLLPDIGRPTELVRGRIVMMNVPNFRHGRLTSRISHLLWSFIEEKDLGTIISDSGVVTEHSPDSVRAPDFAFFSYQRIPKGADPTGYPKIAPELVFEVRSPSDRSSEVLAKVREYLNAGVTVVCVVEPIDRTIIVHYSDRPTITLTVDQELTGLDCLPGFSLPVRRLFE